MDNRKVRRLVRPLLQKLHAYVPGEQPKIRGLVKLNTNENPYPPSPKVLRAVRAAIDGRLRLYPDATASGLRSRLADLHGCPPASLIVGNGSDELLALATRAFVEPGASGGPRCKATVQYFTPSYSLYPVLAQIHDAFTNTVALSEGWSLPSVKELKAGKQWDFQAALTFVTTPNAPTGRGYSTRELETLCASQKGVVVLDEAYVDFARENAMELALRCPNVLVARTFSKAYSLCFQRIGYFVGHPELILALEKIKDSYNVNGLGQVAATATLEDLSYYRKNFAKIVATRDWLSKQLTGLGFRVFESQSNFLLVEPPVHPAKSWLALLRERRILVRWFSLPEVSRFLRITVGSEKEAQRLLRACRGILSL
jgi:histidinol-phosphate aminotransferase